jgi:hypothetical protein
VGSVSGGGGGLSSQAMRLSTHLDLVLRLRMSGGAIPLLAPLCLHSVYWDNFAPVGAAVWKIKGAEVCGTFLCVLCQFNGTS